MVYHSADNLGSLASHGLSNTRHPAEVRTLFALGKRVVGGNSQQFMPLTYTELDPGLI